MIFGSCVLAFVKTLIWFLLYASGIVRGIDLSKNLLYPITPVPQSILASVDLLPQGFIQIPNGLLQVQWFSCFFWGWGIFVCTSDKMWLDYLLLKLICAHLSGKPRTDDARTSLLSTGSTFPLSLTKMTSLEFFSRLNPCSHPRKNLKDVLKFKIKSSL